MHMGDADRILEDASPCMAANGVDPEKARGLVIKTFSHECRFDPEAATPGIQFAPEDDVAIRYMDRTREYYEALGFSPYRWAHFTDAPFTRCASRSRRPASR